MSPNDPFEDMRRDADRVGRWLGEGFVDMWQMADSVLHRVEADGDWLFNTALFRIPDQILEAGRPFVNGFWGKRS